MITRLDNVKVHLTLTNVKDIQVKYDYTNACQHYVIL